MSELPACHVCGCCSYQKVSGFFVCANCDTQSQEIQVQLFDYSTNQRVDEEEEREEIIIQKVEKDRALTSWEIFNFALKRITEKLIDLGASPELKIVAFQIWATYLQKANVAFFSKQIDKLPALPLGFKSSDAKILYGVSNIRKKILRGVRYKKKKTEDDSDVEIDVQSSSSSSNPGTIVSLKSLRKKQRKLALSELSDTSVHNESMFSHNESLLTLGSDRTKKKKRKRVALKSSARKVLRDMITVVEKTKNLAKNDEFLQKVKRAVEKRMNDSKRKPGARNDMVVTFTTVISVIRIALLLIGDDIQLGDIMRWIAEGHISYNLKNLAIPDSKNPDGAEINDKVCNRNGFQTDIENVTKSLGLDSVPTPDLYQLVERYCSELCLPDEFVNYIHGIMNIFQPKMNYSEYDYRTFPNYEYRVLAYILFAFKLLFSLDGITERKQSEFADHVNELHPTKPDLPLLFSWNAWIQYIECRKAILSKYDPIINAHAYQGRVDNKNVFIKQWDKLKQRAALHCYPINTVFISTACETLQKITSTQEPELNIEFPASLTPQTACITYLLNNHPQLIEPNARFILENRFTNHSILHLLDHERCQDIATTCNATIKFVSGIAVEDAELYKDDESELPTISKSTTVPAYAPTSVVITEEESDEQNKRILKPRDQKCKNYGFSFESFIHPEPRSDSTNVFKIYSPAKEYWFFHEYSRRTSSEKFNELAESHLSESFVWLLKELANMITGEARELYLELITIEAVMYSLMENGEYAYKCPFNLYPTEW